MNVQNGIRGGNKGSFNLCKGCRSIVHPIRAVCTHVDTDLPIRSFDLRRFAFRQDNFQNWLGKTHRDDKENDEHEKAWVIRVTLNACKDLLKSFFRSRTTSLETLIDQPAPMASEHREVLEAVLSLPAKNREVIYLHYYEGYSVAEIGEILKLSQSAVKMRLSRGRELLKLEMEG